MTNTELTTYGNLYDIVADNKKKSGAQFTFPKEQFLEELGQAPPELKGVKGKITYVILLVARNSTVQRILQKMPKWILDIGRKLVG